MTKPDDAPRLCKVTLKDSGAKIVEPCWALNESLDHPYGRGTKQQGLTQTYMVSMATGEHSRSPIIFKGGKFSKRGLVVNFCPWCGENIKTHEESDE